MCVILRWYLSLVMLLAQDSVPLVLVAVKMLVKDAKVVVIALAQQVVVKVVQAVANLIVVFFALKVVSKVVKISVFTIVETIV